MSSFELQVLYEPYYITKQISRNFYMHVVVTSTFAKSRSCAVSFFLFVQFCIIWRWERRAEQGYFYLNFAAKRLGCCLVINLSLTVIALGIAPCGPDVSCGGFIYVRRGGGLLYLGQYTTVPRILVAGIIDKAAPKKARSVLVCLPFTQIRWKLLSSKKNQEGRLSFITTLDVLVWWTSARTSETFCKMQVLPSLLSCLPTRGSICNINIIYVGYNVFNLLSSSRILKILLIKTMVIFINKNNFMVKIFFKSPQ